MSDTKDSAQAILTRMREAYGVSSNVELSERIKAPRSTVSNWVSRDSVPFRYIMLCSQQTGVEIDWLLKGEFANANYEGVGEGRPHGVKTQYSKILESGGQALLHRLLIAYGFTMQKQLGDLLGISSGTISTWIRRNFFPGDVVVACALDTGVNLEWLATGNGEMVKATNTDKGRHIDHLELFAGKIIEKGNILIDNALIPSNASYPVYLSTAKMAWIIDTDKNEIASGTLLLNVDGEIDVYNVSKIPGNRITACNVNDGIEFTCGTDDVTSEGRVMLTLISSA
ncbi:MULTISPECIES: phage repressor protein CI [Atlantibacter]|uniref:phage repressor protein CI n=1 Tax=Atlantibacter TaxID=1903434 RepID=UPI0028ABC1EA|nr:MULTISPECIES: phage repressor protein CI [Atlantibacter]